jgi:hypothetical protein
VTIPSIGCEWHYARLKISSCHRATKPVGFVQQGSSPKQVELKDKAEHFSMTPLLRCLGYTVEAGVNS